MLLGVVVAGLLDDRGVLVLEVLVVLVLVGAGAAAPCRHWL